MSGAFEAALRPSQASDEEQIPAFTDEETPFEQNEEPSGPPEPLIEQWWFWTIIGVVVAGGIAAGIAGGVAAQGPPLGNDPGGQVVFTF